jgi:hypothetical protein
MGKSAIANGQEQQQGRKTQQRQRDVDMDRQQQQKEQQQHRDMTLKEYQQRDEEYQQRQEQQQGRKTQQRQQEQRDMDRRHLRRQQDMEIQRGNMRHDIERKRQRDIEQQQGRQPQKEQQQKRRDDSAALRAALGAVERGSELHRGPQATSLRTCMAASEYRAVAKIAEEWRASAERLAKQVKEARVGVDAVTREGASDQDVRQAVVGLMATMRMMSAEVGAWNRDMSSEHALRAATSKPCLQRFVDFMQAQFLANADALELVGRTLASHGPTPR